MLFSWYNKNIGGYMKKGMIIYSQTGNTLLVGEKLNKELNAKIEQIEVEKIGKPDSNIINAPQVDQYDTIFFGAPVQAFSLCSPMNKYLKQLPSLEGKKAVCFVTQGFSKPWLGGNHAIKQMKKVIETKGGEVIDSGVVNWSSKEREDQIDRLIKKCIRYR
jgi:flavodoxin